MKKVYENINLQVYSEFYVKKNSITCAYKQGNRWSFKVKFQFSETDACPLSQTTPLSFDSFLN